jgi:hypothetical protein
VAKIKANEKFFDMLEDKRLNAERVRAKMSSNRAPSRYPGLYEAEDIDDGRLDPEPAAARHFVTANEVEAPEPYIPDEDDLTDVIEQAHNDLALLDRRACARASVREPGYAMPRTVAEFHRRKPPLAKVQVLKRGVGLVPYVPIQRQR